MNRIAFTDGDKICILENGNVKKMESEYIVRYREYAETRQKNDEWKFTGEGARFRGDYDRNRKAERIDAYINGLCWDGRNIVYCFTVNGSSGVYCKSADNEKAREEHIYSANDREILSIKGEGNLYAVTVRGDDVSSQIGTLNRKTSELITLTDGDARDANPIFYGGELLFDSAGVGRTAEGDFTGKYAPAAVLSIHPNTLEIKEIHTGRQYSYTKPAYGQDGALYCIRKSNKEKREGNLFLDIILFPWRILKAIFGFLQAFVMLFSGESLTSAGNNPAKGRKTDGKKLWVDGNVIEAEKEIKRNRKFKDREYGFIPQSWKLVRLGAQEEVLLSGVCDYAFAEEGIVYTDGRHIGIYREGKHKKLADADLCLCVSVERTENGRTMSAEGEQKTANGAGMSEPKPQELDEFF